MTTVSVLKHSDSTLAPLLTVHEAAALCSVGVSTWWRFLSAGKISAPIRLGRAVRWRREELNAWLAANCPPRDKWEAMKKRPVGK